METSTRKGSYLLTLQWKISLTIAASSGITHLFVWKSVVMIKIVIFANHLANLQRFFLKFIIFQTLLFSDVYETTTTEAHCPSLAKHTGKTKTLPFVASVQHVRSVSVMIQCEECGIWHLLYSPIKLSSIGWLHTYMWGNSQWFGTHM